MRVARAIILITGLCGFVGTVHAQEIRVLDPQGLTRAVQPSLDPMTVEIAVVSPATRMLGGATLVQTSGLVDDKAAIGEGGRYVFSGVPPGTWQVKFIEPSERVRSIRIVK